MKPSEYQSVHIVAHGLMSVIKPHTRYVDKNACVDRYSSLRNLSHTSGIF